MDKSCENCLQALYIGEGDYICDVDGCEQERGLVISDWIYDGEMPCHGEDWEAL
jgi:hypothetical protein